MRYFVPKKRSNREQTFQKFIFVPKNRQNREQTHGTGNGLKTIVYMPEKQEPELMYKLFDGVVGSMDELVKAI